jgi:hypothetical protein
MTRLALALAAFLSGRLMAAPDSGLAAALARARAEFGAARSEAELAEGEAAPLAESVRRLKGVEDPWWWTRYRLRRGLRQLQESLDRLREARGRYESGRQELFLVLSAMQEEMRSALNRELARARPRAERVKALFERKDLFDKELEGMGFGEGKPFPLADAPGTASYPLLKADRQKALQARAIQLEAWSDTVKEDIRLVRRAAEGRALEGGPARARLMGLEALAGRISRMIRENELRLSKN